MADSEAFSGSDSCDSFKLALEGVGAAISRFDRDNPSESSPPDAVETMDVDDDDLNARVSDPGSSSLNEVEHSKDLMNFPNSPSNAIENNPGSNNLKDVEHNPDHMTASNLHLNAHLNDPGNSNLNHVEHNMNIPHSPSNLQEIYSPVNLPSSADNLPSETTAAEPSLETTECSESRPALNVPLETELSDYEEDDASGDGVRDSPREKETLDSGRASAAESEDDAEVGGADQRSGAGSSDAGDAAGEPLDASFLLQLDSDTGSGNPSPAAQDDGPQSVEAEPIDLESQEITREDDMMDTVAAMGSPGENSADGQVQDDVSESVQTGAGDETFGDEKVQSKVSEPVEVAPNDLDTQESIQEDDIAAAAGSPRSNTDGHEESEEAQKDNIATLVASPRVEDDNIEETDDNDAEKGYNDAGKGVNSAEIDDAERGDNDAGRDDDAEGEIDVEETFENVNGPEMATTTAVEEGDEERLFESEERLRSSSPAGDDDRATSPDEDEQGGRATPASDQDGRVTPPSDQVNNRYVDDYVSDDEQQQEIEDRVEHERATRSDRRSASPESLADDGEEDEEEEDISPAYEEHLVGTSPARQSSADDGEENRVLKSPSKLRVAEETATIDDGGQPGEGVAAQPGEEAASPTNETMETDERETEEDHLATTGDQEETLACVVVEEQSETQVAEQAAVVEDAAAPADPIFLLPFQLGWKRKVFFHSGKNEREVIYTEPLGRRLRSLKELGNYLLRNDITIVSKANFCFDPEVDLSSNYTPREDADSSSLSLNADAENYASQEHTAEQQRLQQQQGGGKPKIQIASFANFSFMSETPDLLDPDLVDLDSDDDDSGGAIVPPGGGGVSTKREQEIWRKQIVIGGDRRPPPPIVTTAAAGTSFPSTYKAALAAGGNVTVSEFRTQQTVQPLSWLEQQYANAGVRPVPIGTAPTPTPSAAATGPLQPCSINCPLARHVIPDLTCVMCCCMYHTRCVGQSNIDTSRFTCRNCQQQLQRSKRNVDTSRFTCRNCQQQLQATRTGEIDLTMEDDDEVMLVDEEQHDSTTRERNGIRPDAGRSQVGRKRAAEQNGDEIVLDEDSNDAQAGLPQSPPPRSRPLPPPLPLPRPPQGGGNPGLPVLTPAPVFVRRELCEELMRRESEPADDSAAARYLESVSANMSKIVDRAKELADKQIRNAMLSKSRPPVFASIKVGAMAATPKTSDGAKSRGGGAKTKILHPKAGDEAPYRPQMVVVCNGKTFIAVSAPRQPTEDASRAKQSTEHSKDSTNKDTNVASHNGGLTSPVEQRKKPLSLINATGLSPAKKQKLMRMAEALEKSQKEQVFSGRRLALYLSLRYLTAQDLTRASRVSKLWHEVALHPSLWETVRLKNSRVYDWQAFARHLSRVGTVRLDLRKLLNWKDVSTMWQSFVGTQWNIESLRHVDFGGRCPAAAVAGLVGCRNLESLSALTIGDQQMDFAPLGKLSLLKELRLKSSSAKTTPAPDSLRSIGLLGQLTHLSITNIDKVSSDDWGSMIESLTELRSLELGFCGMLAAGDKFMNALANAKQLEKLRLEECSSGADGALFSAIAELPSLSKLELLNIKLSTGSAKALAKMANVKELLLIPQYQQQVGASNQQIIAGVSKLTGLTFFVWALTTEFLKSVEAEMSTKTQPPQDKEANGKKAAPKDHIPVLKMVAAKPVVTPVAAESSASVDSQAAVAGKVDENKQATESSAASTSDGVAKEKDESEPMQTESTNNTATSNEANESRLSVPSEKETPMDVDQQPTGDSTSSNTAAEASVRSTPGDDKETSAAVDEEKEKTELSETVVQQAPIDATPSVVKDSAEKSLDTNNAAGEQAPPEITAPSQEHSSDSLSSSIGEKPAVSSDEKPAEDSTGEKHTGEKPSVAADGETATDESAAGVESGGVTATLDVAPTATGATAPDVAAAAPSAVAPSAGAASGATAAPDVAATPDVAASPDTAADDAEQLVYIPLQKVFRQLSKELSSTLVKIIKIPQSSVLRQSISEIQILSSRISSSNNNPTAGSNSR